MPPRSRYQYDEASARYRSRTTGRFVPRAAVRAELDRVIARNAHAMQTLGRQLQGRQISVARFELEMRGRIKALHTASVALARGGWGQMRPGDYLAAGRAIKGQYAYLRRFARELASGLPRDGRLLRRVAMYANAARTAYHDVDRREQEARGATEERSVRHAQDSCATVGAVLGCIEAEQAGWQPIGTLPLPGSRVCLTSCRCTLSYK